jgi:acetyl-CoA C-acetyltransferase
VRHSAAASQEEQPMPEAVIVAAGRSPIGRAFKGHLVDVRPDDLAAHVATKVLEQVPQLEPEMIDDLMCGCGLPGGEQGFNLGRAVSILARLDTPGCTITRYCASSLQTTRMAYHAIKAGEGDVFLSVGVECVSRYGNGTSDIPTARNPRLLPGNAEEYPDVYIAMGETAENVADRENVTREEMDRYAVKSQTAAVAAREGGFFDREIVPVPLPNGELFARDDGPRPGTTVEVLATLQPAFRENGRVTAGNACPLNDGAAAVVVMSDTRARELGIEPLARVVSTGVTALEPEIMGLGPIEASKQALRRAGMTIDDIDVVELNEAFAAQVIPSARGLGIDPFGDKLNPHGGAIALGHPFGMTGARILCTLLNDLRTLDLTYGLETMCVGGGQGMAMIVERLN